MASLEKELVKAVDSIVDYKTTVEKHTKTQVHRYVRACSLLTMLLPSTSKKAWVEVQRRLDVHTNQTYR